MPLVFYIDDFLSKEAIKELREFSLVSKVWIHQMPNKYLGAFSDSGFISPLHIQIGTELQEKLPTIPSTIKEELECNIFLRSDNVKTFSKLRDLKDNF